MIIIKFAKYGGVQMMPLGYPDGTCHQATEPYERGMTGEKKVVEKEAQATEIQVAVTQPQMQRVGG